MYRIIDGKGTGKTSRLLLLAKENNGIVVCADPNKMRSKAYAYGLVGIDFLSYEEYMRSDYLGKPVYIDELDTFLQEYDAFISGYTLSED